MMIETMMAKIPSADAKICARKQASGGSGGLVPPTLSRAGTLVYCGPRLASC